MYNANEVYDKTQEDVFFSFFKFLENITIILHGNMEGSLVSYFQVCSQQTYVDIMNKPPLKKT